MYLAELGDGFDGNMKVADLTEEQILRLYQLFREMKFSPPDGVVGRHNGISPFCGNII